MSNLLTHDADSSISRNLIQTLLFSSNIRISEHKVISNVIELL